MNYTIKPQNFDVREQLLSRLAVLSLLSSSLNESIDGGHHSLLI